MTSGSDPSPADALMTLGSMPPPSERHMIYRRSLCDHDFLCDHITIHRHICDEAILNLSQGDRLIARKYFPDNKSNFPDIFAQVKDKFCIVFQKNKRHMPNFLFSCIVLSLFRVVFDILYIINQPIKFFEISPDISKFP